MSDTFFKLIRNPIKFRFFLLSKLPSAYFSGVKVAYADECKCMVTVSYKWFSKNPFKSTYFACLAMAAEMSTGVLALAHIYKRTPAVSMLVIKIEGNFFKKAIGKTNFTCEDGILLKQIIEAAANDGQAKQLTAKAIGTNEAGEIIAEFFITWGFKTKSSQR